MVDYEDMDGDTLHRIKEYIAEQVHERVDALMIGLSDEHEDLIRTQLTESFRFWKRRKPEDSVTQLAKAFSAILKTWLTAEQMQQVVGKNWRYQEESLSFCASHEFCDANQAMLDAMEDLGYGDWPLSLMVTGDLIDRAWDLAKANDFYTEA